MKLLAKRLQRLERLKHTKRSNRQWMVEFNIAMNEYIRSALSYLGEPLDSEPSISCRAEGDVIPAMSRVYRLYLRTARYRVLHNQLAIESSTSMNSRLLGRTDLGLTGSPVVD